MGWGEGPNNVLLLHPHRRVFLRYHSYVKVRMMVHICGCYAGTTSACYGCYVTDATLLRWYHVCGCDCGTTSAAFAVVKHVILSFFGVMMGWGGVGGD